MTTTTLITILKQLPEQEVTTGLLAAYGVLNNPQEELDAEFKKLEGMLSGDDRLMPGRESDFVKSLSKVKHLRKFIENIKYKATT